MKPVDVLIYAICLMNDWYFSFSKILKVLKKKSGKKMLHL